MEDIGPDRTNRMERAGKSGGTLGERSNSGNDGGGLVGAGGGNVFSVFMEKEDGRALTVSGEAGSLGAFSAEAAAAEAARCTRGPEHLGSVTLAGISVKTSDDVRESPENSVVLSEDPDCELDIGNAGNPATLLIVWYRGTSEALQAAMLDLRGGTTSGKSVSVCCDGVTLRTEDWSIWSPLKLSQEALGCDAVSFAPAGALLVAFETDLVFCEVARVLGSSELDGRWTCSSMETFL